MNITLLGERKSGLGILRNFIRFINNNIKNIKNIKNINNNNNPKSATKILKTDFSGVHDNIQHPLRIIFRLKNRNHTLYFLPINLSNISIKMGLKTLIKIADRLFLVFSLGEDKKISKQLDQFKLEKFNLLDYLPRSLDVCLSKMKMITGIDKKNSQKKDEDVVKLIRNNFEKENIIIDNLFYIHQHNDTKSAEMRNAHFSSSISRLCMGKKLISFKEYKNSDPVDTRISGNSNKNH